MTITELFNILVDDIINKIQNSKGLARFAYRRAKFEGWLKVEIIDILVRQEINALPEIDRVDVSFDSVGIELKTVNTNIFFDNVIHITRPITKNTNSVIKDIKKLRSKNYQDKFIIFVVFPIDHSNQYWQKQFQRISSELTEINQKQFNFNNNVPAVIYVGRV